MITFLTIANSLKSYPSLAGMIIFFLFYLTFCSTLLLNVALQNLPLSDTHFIMHFDSFLVYYYNLLLLDEGVLHDLLILECFCVFLNGSMDFDLGCVVWLYIYKLKMLKSYILYFKQVSIHYNALKFSFLLINNLLHYFILYEYWSYSLFLCVSWFYVSVLCI